VLTGNSVYSKLKETKKKKSTGLLGWGKTKRRLLGDNNTYNGTMSFTEDEYFEYEEEAYDEYNMDDWLNHNPDSYFIYNGLRIFNESYFVMLALDSDEENDLVSVSKRRKLIAIPRTLPTSGNYQEMVAKEGNRSLIHP
jgi:hypothetical protein